MADIVVSSKKKINFFDRVIQSVVIMLNMNKMNKAIDEHLSVIRKTEGDDKKIYQENILREIVVYGILSCALAFPLINGTFDLSISSISALGGNTCAMLVAA